MEWINVKLHKPETSQPYLISISSIDSSKNIYVYNYYAYYNVETEKFYEYNSQTAKIGEPLNRNVLGWLRGVTTYLG